MQGREQIKVSAQEGLQGAAQQPPLGGEGLGL